MTTLSYSLVAVDSDAFGFPVGRIDTFELGAEDDPKVELDRFEAWRDEHALTLVSCRLDHRRLRESMALEARGFRFIELVYRPRFDGVQSLSFGDQGLAIEPAKAADLPQIEAIARSAFTTGRHALDFRLDPTLSPRRYVTWVRSALHHPTQRLLKADVDGRVAGFFVIEALPGKRCYWHLTAVAPAAQGGGVGKRLWRAMLMRHRTEGIETVETCVSGHNLPVLNLYATLGFRLAACEMTLHWMRGR